MFSRDSILFVFSFDLFRLIDQNFDVIFEVKEKINYMSQEILLALLQLEIKKRKGYDKDYMHSAYNAKLSNRIVK